MVKKNKSTWLVKAGSTFTGVGLGLLLIYYFFPFFSFVPENLYYITYIIGGIVGGIFGLALPKPTETFAFAFSVFILFQFGWDGRVEPNVGNIRIDLAWRAFYLLVLNAVGGELRVDKAIKIMLNAIGLGK